MATKPKPYNYYTIWSGSLNLGDTPGVFYNSAFVGLIIQMPIYFNYIPKDKEYVEIMLVTSEVEIFEGKAHNVYLDWVPGESFPEPIGKIDDTELIPNMPEYHKLKIPTDGLTLGNHTLTIVVNNEIQAGLNDDFILKRIDVDNYTAAKLGFTRHKPC